MVSKDELLKMVASHIDAYAGTYEYAVSSKADVEQAIAPLFAMQARLEAAYWKAKDSHRRFLGMNQAISKELWEQKNTLYVELVKGFVDILGYTPTREEETTNE